MGFIGEHEIVYGLRASILAGAISIVGILAVAVARGWVRRNSPFFSAFAIGLLSVAVLFHLVPESLDLSTNAIGWVTAGFALMVLVGIGVEFAVSRRPEGAALTFGYASIIGLGAHSFLDGVIYAASFQEDALTGWLAVGGLLTHEFPEGVIAFVLLTQAGLGLFRAMIFAAIAASFTTVVGTVSAYSLIDFLGEPPLAAMFGGAAGALIYVLIVHLAPHAAKAPNRHGYTVAQFGVVVGVAALLAKTASGVH